MKKIISKSLLVAALAVLAVTAVQPASAAQWMLPSGIVVSNICSNPTGAYFVFVGNYGPVGAPCQWTFGGGIWNYGVYGG